MSLSKKSTVEYSVQEHQTEEAKSLDQSIQLAFTVRTSLMITTTSNNRNKRAMSPLVLVGLVALAVLFGGLISVITLALLYWLSSRPFGVDREGKHGISQKDSSRLGGTAIFVSVLLFSVGAPWLSDSVALLIELNEDEIGTIKGYQWLACIIGLVGLADDFNFGLKPMHRMLLLFALSIAGFVWTPEWLPDLHRFSVYSELLTIPLVTIILSAFVLVGFTNAANMVDGANGLLGIVATVFFLLVYLLTNEPLYWALVLAISTFILFNTVTGRIFMGDFGAYTIGALIVLVAYQVFNTQAVSIWLFASFLSYPCVEIIRVMSLRLLQGKSPIISDNNHLHNFLHQFLLVRFESPLVANSITGALLASLSSVLPLGLYTSDLVTKSSSLWEWIFVTQTGTFLLLAFFLSNREATSQTD